MKILVTGGTGYIGSHTVVELQQQGYEVVIVDDLSNSRAEVVDAIAQITGKKPEFYHFSLADAEKTKAFFKNQPEIKAIIHFAAHKAVGESMAEPLMYYRNNLVSLINLLQGMKDNGISRFVFSSSCTVYGQPDELPVKESSPIKDAWSPYGNTKQMSEQMLQFACTAYGFEVIALRYFNPVGAHDSAIIGELPLGVPNNLVPYITQTAIGIRPQLMVFGNDYPTPDGTPIRDYIHVADLAKAHVVAVKRLQDQAQKAPFEVFNLGTGTGYSVLDVIRAFERVSGLPLNYKITHRRPGDIEKVWADTTFANEELGWKATLGLDQMMRSAWKWEQALMQQKLPDMP